jgi:endonuclease G
MNPIGFMFRRRRTFKVALFFLLVYAGISIGYYHLPWSVRMPVYKSVPQLDRVLRRSGFRILIAWDNLALIGRDAAAPADNSGRSEHVYGGYPSQGFRLFGRVDVLENRGYVSGYSESQKNPLWVAYRIFDVPKLSAGKRPTRFKTDRRTASQIGHSDYTGSGFDRGHMAPNFGIATRYGREAQEETFLMTNIIPQNPRVNRYLWKDLEQTVARRYGRYFSEVWVVTGPVFGKSGRKLESGVPVPSAYYKIIADEHDGKLRTLAFLVEEDLPPYTRVRKRLVSIDQIENLTGLDFFPELPEAVQSQIESDPATRLWPSLVPAINYRLRGRTQ